MRGELLHYFLGVAVWLLGWGAAFAVSALATRRRLHGTLGGDLLLMARDLVAGAVAYGGWRALLPVRSEGRGPAGLLAGLLTLAGLCTAAYLQLLMRRGINRVETPQMFKQRHPLIPLRILSFVLFQQLAATCMLLDWHRIFFDDRTALLLTAAVFALTHLGVVLFGLSLRVGVTLTLASGVAMLLWGGLRLSYGSAWAGVLIHFLFYMVLACHDALRGHRAASER